MEYPRLVETSFRDHLSASLRGAHETRAGYYQFIFNSCVFAFLVIVFGLALWCARAKKLEPEARHRAMERDKERVIAKIREYQARSLMSARDSETFVQKSGFSDLRDMFEL
jgi:H+/Cl- antiporter ClcA